MKIGISVRIDVTKLDKSRFYKGEKGTYADLTTFIDLDNKDQYENNGFICQSVTKEERESGLKLPILGNVKVFSQDRQQQSQRNTGYDNAPVNQRQPNPAMVNPEPFDDNLPF